MLYIDVDGDGYDAGQATVCYGATIPAGYKLTTLGGDCNDNDASTHATQTWYLDADGDSHYVSSVSSCGSPGAGYNTTGGTLGDCNDNDNSKWQSALLYIDVDGDGYDAGQATVCYGATIPAGYKSTTLGSDCNDNNAAIKPTTIWYKDADNDNYSDGTTQTQCLRPSGYKLAAELTAITGDCNDANAAVNPGAAEICGNGIDDNCNGQVDENCTAACQNATNLTTSGITSNSATFNWTASANPTQWQVQYKSTNQGSKWIDVTVSGTARSVTISSLAANQSYQWHIRAKCGKTCTAYSNTVSFKTLTKTRTTVNTSSIVTKAEPIDKGIRLYPNPSRGQFVVELQVAEK